MLLAWWANSAYLLLFTPQFSPVARRPNGQCELITPQTGVSYALDERLGGADKEGGGGDEGEGLNIEREGKGGGGRRGS